jgi:gamma-glutamylcyclotransferase (GGCT)/AIG2-like uncharacterized protein YtfP
MFWYFGYGSNISLASLHAKGVDPRVSHRATLRGWQLCFNVKHFFPHEGGVGNITRTDDSSDVVRGVVHLCEDAHLKWLDAAEAYGHGYDRQKVCVDTDYGERRALTYVGARAFIDNSCLPTKRYLNIMIKGAVAAGLDLAYVDALRRHPVLQNPPVQPFEPPEPLPGKCSYFTEGTLTGTPPLTALAGFVFDMSGARSEHAYLKTFFGGKDMTDFHLKRLDIYDGSFGLLNRNGLTPRQRRHVSSYLDEYLHAYRAEYAYVGRYVTVEHRRALERIGVLQPVKRTQ